MYINFYSDIITIAQIKLIIYRFSGYFLHFNYKFAHFLIIIFLPDTWNYPASKLRALKALEIKQ